MNLVKAEGGQVVEWPYSLHRLRQDNPNVSFPENISPSDLAEFGVFIVDTPDPPIVTRTQRFEERPPAFVAGQWVLQFAVIDYPPEEAAIILEQFEASKRLGVVAERTRRLAAGFDYDFQDERGVHRIGMDEKDLKGWDEVSKGAAAAMSLGLGNSTTLIIVTQTGPAIITCVEWQKIVLAGMVQRQPIWTASFQLQGMNPIPDDYTNDAYWP